MGQGVRLGEGGGLDALVDAAAREGLGRPQIGRRRGVGLDVEGRGAIARGFDPPRALADRFGASAKVRAAMKRC